MPLLLVARQPVGARRRLAVRRAAVAVAEEAAVVAAGVRHPHRRPREQSFHHSSPEQHVDADPHSVGDGHVFGDARGHDRRPDRHAAAHGRAERDTDPAVRYGHADANQYRDAAADQHADAHLDANCDSDRPCPQSRWTTRSAPPATLPLACLRTAVY